MWKIWKPNIYYQVSCGYECKREKKSTRFVRLVLTGVRIKNFFSIADFDLIFLHNTQILSVCLSVGLFVMYRKCEYWSSCTSVCLFVCVCLYVFISVCL